MTRKHEEMSDTELWAKLTNVGSRHFKATIIAVLLLGVPSVRDVIHPKEEAVTQADVATIKSELEGLTHEVARTQRDVDRLSDRLDARLQASVPKTSPRQRANSEVDAETEEP